MSKFRKKPVVIEAMQFTKDTFDECVEFIGEENLNDGTSKDECYIGIITLEGDHSARSGDWIIKGVAGEFYPCRDDIFKATYEPVEECRDCGACDGAGHRCMDCEKELTAKGCEECSGICIDCSRLLL